MRQHYPTVGSHDRLTVTLFLAALFHMILILGISFSPPVADTGDVPTLEVLLVNNPLPDAAWNEEANYLAERTQQGSGNSPDGRTRQPSAGEGAESIMGDPLGGTVQPAPEGRPGTCSPGWCNHLRSSASRPAWRWLCPRPSTGF